MKIGIVILNWNGRQLLEQFVPTMLANSKHVNVNIYIADNASTDDSVQYIKEHFPTVTIIQNKVNGGFAKGYNDALKDLNETVFCLVNSDIEVSKNWLTPIFETFESDKDIAIVQPKILDFKNKTYFEYAGAAGGFIDKFGYPYCRGRLFKTLEKDLNQYGNTEIFWASGACFFIKSDVFFELGGFDEDYFAHQEEIDLCWRAKNIGKKIVFVNDAVVYHVGGATLSNQNSKKTFLNFRNSLFSLVKNLPKNKLVPVIGSRLILDGFAGMKFLCEFKFKHFVAILQAHFSFYAQLNKMLKKRNKDSKLEHYFNVQSIVFSYFVQRKKYFKDL